MVYDLGDTNGAIIPNDIVLQRNSKGEKNYFNLLKLSTGLSVRSLFFSLVF